MGIGSQRSEDVKSAAMRKEKSSKKRVDLPALF